ncbi:hypothetical protein L227DRAFT_193944 [Lentinus tigrinus ALCF2SS1-6]|uniref:Uncharacterized protein n=1 Tax=Lentinus tigrinus ALCF2SS1-6 TaxID=1328759 RepID=A0A5C2S400_9APHY|nr:hypothetical protein L227DRAFT_193944 [Lentinus tigrinus ALCF2SS1-6]
MTRTPRSLHAAPYSHDAASSLCRTATYPVCRQSLDRRRHRRLNARSENFKPYASGVDPLGMVLSLPCSLRPSPSSHCVPTYALTYWLGKLLGRRCGSMLPRVRLPGRQLCNVTCVAFSFSELFGHLRALDSGPSGARPYLVRISLIAVPRVLVVDLRHRILDCMFSASGALNEWSKRPTESCSHQQLHGIGFTVDLAQRAQGQRNSYT